MKTTKSLLALLLAGCTTANAPTTAPPALERGERTPIEATERVCHTAPDFPYTALRCGDHPLLASCGTDWDQHCRTQGGTPERCADGCPDVRVQRRPGLTTEAWRAASRDPR